MFGWQLQEALRRDPRAAQTLVGVYTRGEHWPPPSRFPAAYLVNTARQGPGEHWVALFLEDSTRAEYFCSYGTAPLEDIYQRLRDMGYRDVRYSTKMLQGPWSRSCGLYAFYFVAMRSRGLPLGTVTSAFREYDFAFNEATIRRVLR